MTSRVLVDGKRKENRTGVDTLSKFGEHYTVDLQKGFPMLTTKAVSWKNIVIEMLWFLSGSTDIGILQKHGCKFWDSWAGNDGRVPSAYGYFWRQFPQTFDSVGKRIPEGYDGHVDQLARVVDMLKKSPNTRRAVVTAWLPENALNSKLPPCHLMFVFNTQYDYDGNQSLCLHLTQRSADIALGVPYNLASYALLLHLMSRFVGIPVGLFSHSLVDAHIYTSKPDGSMAEYDHVPGLLEQVNRNTLELPMLELDESIQSLEDVERLTSESTETILDKIKLVGYTHHPAIKFKVAV